MARRLERESHGRARVGGRGWGQTGAVTRRSEPRVVGLVVLSLATAAATAVAAWWASSDLAPGCPGYDDEGTIRAPASLAGRVVCSDGGTGEPRAWVLLVAAVLLWPVLEVVWLAACRRLWVVPAVVLVVASPLAVSAAVSALPADCTAAQRAAHGAAGCERDLELR